MITLTIEKTIEYLNRIKHDRVILKRRGQEIELESVKLKIANNNLIVFAQWELGSIRFEVPLKKVLEPEIDKYRSKNFNLITLHFSVPFSALVFYCRKGVIV